MSGSSPPLPGLWAVWAGGGRGNQGGGLEAGLASHGGRAEPVVESVVELVGLVRTSESAGRRDPKD